MFLPTRHISLHIPDSPIEKQTLRSRSFRKIVLTICVFALVLISCHSITARSTLRQELAQDYLKIYKQGSGVGWLSAAQTAGGIAVEVGVCSHSCSSRMRNPRNVAQRDTRARTVCADDAIDWDELCQRTCWACPRGHLVGHRVLCPPTVF